MTHNGAAAALTMLPSPPDLTTEDLAILRLIADGRTNAEIGKALFLSTHTARNRILALCRQLGTEYREHASAIGVVHRLVTKEHLTGVPFIRPKVRDSDRPLLALAITGTSDAEIATSLTRSQDTVRDDLKRLRGVFFARTRGLAQVAASATLLDFVTCHAVDPRFPDVPLSELPVADTEHVERAR